MCSVKDSSVAAASISRLVLAVTDSVRHASYTEGVGVSNCSDARLQAVAAAARCFASKGIVVGEWLESYLSSPTVRAIAVPRTGAQCVGTSEAIRGEAHLHSSGKGVATAIAELAHLQRVGGDENLALHPVHELSAVSAGTSWLRLSTALRMASVWTILRETQGLRLSTGSIGVIGTAFFEAGMHSMVLRVLEDAIERRSTSNADPDDAEVLFIECLCAFGSFAEANLMVDSLMTRSARDAVGVLRHRRGVQLKSLKAKALVGLGMYRQALTVYDVLRSTL